MSQLENILLVSCRSPFLESDKVYPPLANLYLHSAVNRWRPHVRVNITDDYSLENDNWMQGYDGIGVSVMTPQRAEAKKLLDFIQERRPEVKVFAGGPHAKYYGDTMTNEGWDHIVTHDGLRSIIQLIDGTDEKVITDKISIQEYAKYAVKPARLENAPFLREFNYKLNGRDSTTMLCAQGCPEHCTFCEDAFTQVRWTPFNLVMEELDDIQELGYGGAYIFDDIFAIAQKKIEPIARELKKRDLIYRCNGQARMFNPKFAQMLAETGCYEIAFGAETGSQKILDNIKKRTTVEMNYNFVKWCKENGIICKAFLMLGLPGEDRKTVDETEKFIATSGIDDFQLAIYYPYRGTQIRDSIDRGETGFDLEFEGEGLGAYGQKGGYSEAVVRTKEFTAQQLVEERDRLLKMYKPHSHAPQWHEQDDKFFDTWLENKDIKLGCSNPTTPLTIGGKTQ